MVASTFYFLLVEKFKEITLSEPSSPKISKLLWLIFMLIVMTLYLLVVSRLIDSLFTDNRSLQFICYFVAGIIWIFPAKWVMFAVNGKSKSGGK